jgi:NitT/TauT family transport system permease protein
MSADVSTPRLTVGAPRRSRAAGRFHRPSNDDLRVYGLRLLLALVILAVWQWMGSSSSRTDFFISTPLAVWDSLVKLVPTGAFWADVRATLYETLVGFLIGGAAGVAAGFLLAFSKTAYRVVEPLLNALNSLPRIALASLFILYFGLGSESKIALVISLVFFPLFLNAYKGATTVDPDYALLMHTFKAGRLHYVVKVILPSTVPWLITGAKLGVAQGLGGAIIGEIISAQVGLGAALNGASNAFDTAGEFAILLVLIIIAMLLNGLFETAERATSKWR